MFIAMLILTLVASAVGIADNVTSGIARKKVSEKAAKLAQQIDRNSELRDKLFQAYQAKDYALANMLIQASPFSGAYNKIVEESKAIKKEYEAKDKQLRDEIDKIRDKKNSVESHSSASGIVDGAMGIHSANKTDTTYNNVEGLVNAGISNINSGSLSGNIGPINMKGSK